MSTGPAEDTPECVHDMIDLFARGKISEEALPEFIGLSKRALQAYRSEHPQSTADIVLAEDSIRMIQIRGFSHGDVKYLSRVLEHYAEHLSD